MIGRRRTHPRGTTLRQERLRALHGIRSARASALSLGAFAVCASLTAGCGVLPGTGGSEDDRIVVMTWAPADTSATNKPGMPSFARAYARWVNANGGLNGRKLTVLTCNDHNDTVSAANCARRAVREKAVAVVGSYSQYSNAFLPPLEGAGIPYIGGYGVTSKEFTSQLSYPVNGGQPTLLAGLGKELAGTCEGPVALVRPDTIAGDALPPMLDAGLKAGGHAEAVDRRAAEDATEYSSQAEGALDDATGDPSATGCVLPVLGDHTSTFMDSFRRSRSDYREVGTATVVGSVDQTVLDASGGASGPYEGSYVTGWYPVASDERWDGMKDIIRREAFSDTSIDPADTGVQTTYIAYRVFQQAVESLGDGEVSADTVGKALDKGRFTTGGLTPTLHWKFSDRLGSIGLPRLVNRDVTLQTVRKGRLVAAKKGFVDMTRTLESADLD